jgi:hypothetical protein
MNSSMEELETGHCGRVLPYHDVVTIRHRRKPEQVVVSTFSQHETRHFRVSAIKGESAYLVE